MFPNNTSVTVAIVGCGGFIGSHLMNAILCRTKWRIFGVDTDCYRIQQYLQNERVEFFCSDLSAPGVVQRIAQFPIVVNLAAICTPSRYMSQAVTVIRSNYDYPALLAEACQKSGSWLIHFSTSEVYGKTPADSGPLKEDETPLIFGPVQSSRWSYATAKLLTERFVAGLENLRWTMVRPFNFVGPYMDFMPGVDGEGIPRVLANFSTALLKGEPIKLVNGGCARRSFTSVFDAMDFLFDVFASPEKAFYQTFNVGNPENEVTIAELAEKMRRIYAQLRGVSLASIPEPCSIDGEAYYGVGYDDSLRRLPDVEKAERLLGFKASTPLDVVLRESLSWFVDHYGAGTEL